MKKVLLALLPLLLCSCDSSSSTQIPNPLVQYNRLDDALKVVNFEFEYDDIYYDRIYVINKETLELRYDDMIIRKKVLNKEYKGIENISGVYESYKCVETKTIDSYEVIIKRNDDRIYLAVWNSDEYAYSVYSKNGLTFDDMKTIILKIK